MPDASPRRIVPLSVVAVGATTLGLVLAGGLGLTPLGCARDAGVLATPAAAQTEARPAATAGAPVRVGFPDFAELADRVLPSTISVYTEDRVTSQEMRRFHRDMPTDPFEFFFGPNRGTPPGQMPKRQGAGSGFFIDASGLAMTNNHVVEGADEIEVQLSDDVTRLKAKVVGRDPATDIALIKVEGKGPFQPLAFGDSENLRVGEWVMAAGNPLNMAHTITVGVVSAKGRTLFLSEETRSFENFIQTDAAINLGNSGGPLVNLRGEVVGINTAINAAGQNMGFAVPVNTAKLVLPQLREKGRVVRGYLGVMVQNVDEKIQQAFDLPSRDGAFVQEVERDGPAAESGLEKGDTIVAVAGEKVTETRDLIDRVSGTPPGEKVDLDVVRDGKRRTLRVTVGERPGTEEEQAAPRERADSPQGRIGVRVDTLDVRTRRSLGIPSRVDGVVVTEVDDPSPAEDAGLREGDVITEVNGQPVASSADLDARLSKARSGSYVRLYVYRPQAERSTFVVVQMP